MTVRNFPGLVRCASTDGFPDRPDGTYLTFTDTGEQFLHVGGNWEPWELGLSFAPPTKSFNIFTNNDGLASIIFVEPFVDTNYTVGLTCYSQGGNLAPIALLIDGSKAMFGFGIATVDYKNRPMRDVLVTWLATRHNP